MRFLVVDDEPVIAEILAAHLEAKGHTVAAIGDGAAALVAWVAEPFDVLVADLGLPGLSGVDLLREIRGLGGAEPCLLISGRIDASLLSDKPELQPARALAKPFSFSEFEQELDALLGT